MHIAVDALLLKNQNTGTGFYTHHLLKAIAALGTPHRFTVFVDASYRHTAAFETPSVDIVRVPVASTLRRIIWEQAVLPRRLRECGAQLLFCPFFIKPFLTELPVVLTIHDVFHKAAPQTISLMRRLYLSPLITHSIRTAAHLIAVSQYTKTDLIRFYQLPSGCITVVYEAAAEGLNRPPDSVVQQTMQKHKVPFEKFILTVGTLERRKNFGVLLRAIQLLSLQQRTLQVVMVGGENNDSAALRTLAGQLGVAAQIHFAGYIPTADLPAFYAAARAVVVPSLYEGFGLPVVEAMQLGVPVIVANRTALPEIAGDAALRFSTTEELSAALRQVWEEDAMCSHLIALGKHRVESFSWRRAAEQTVNVFENTGRR